MSIIFYIVLSFVIAFIVAVLYNIYIYKKNRFKKELNKTNISHEEVESSEGEQKIDL